MSRKQPFRVLIIDDVSVNNLKEEEGTPLERSLADRRSASNGYLRIAKRLHGVGLRANAESADGSSFGCPLDVYASPDVLLTDVEAATPNTDPWSKSTLETVHILVLDLAGVGKGRAIVTKEDLRRLLPPGEEASDTELEADAENLNEMYPGAAWLLKEWNGRLASCRAVLVVSGGLGGSSWPRTALRHLARLCVPGLPRFIGAWTTDRADHVVAFIEDLYQRFQDGYTFLNNISDIEFAATHDDPVLIVGESGTGKEGIAEAINRRWARLRPAGAQGWAVLNCAASSGKFIRTELFGCVKGAHNAADCHIAGMILGMCVKFGGNQDIATPQDYRNRVQSASQGRIVPEDGHPWDLRYVGPTPVGTIFLDEFADMPPDVQVALLRFMGTADLNPLGYPGLIRGLKVRVVAATSDPRVGDFVGRPLKGSWRSDEESQQVFRPDLLYRTNGQVIRSEPLSVENAEERIAHLIDRAGTEWTPEARERLRKYVVDQLTRIDECVRALSAGRAVPLLPVFGHMRQVGRLVQLANRYVAAADICGLQTPRFRVVTSDVVDQFWSGGHIRTRGTAQPRQNEEPEPPAKPGRELSFRVTIPLANGKYAWEEANAVTKGGVLPIAYYLAILRAEGVDFTCPAPPGMSERDPLHAKLHGWSKLRVPTEAAADPSEPTDKKRSKTGRLAPPPDSRWHDASLWAPPARIVEALHRIADRVSHPGLLGFPGILWQWGLLPDFVRTAWEEAVHSAPPAGAEE